MTASRALTDTALMLFIKHYFSFPWLREYLLKRKVQFEIENASFDDETINDLLFVIRMCNEWFVTAKSLSEIMTRFEDLNTTYYPRSTSSPFIVSSYFFAHSASKMNSPDEKMSSLWRQVALVPIEKQYEYDYYSLAKKREAELLGYNVDRKFWELLEQNRHLQKTCLDPYLTAEWKNRAKMELLHYFKDRIQFYYCLYEQAKAKRNDLLAEAWIQVVEGEERLDDGTSTMTRSRVLLKAWSLQRASDLTSPVRTIYRCAGQFFESGSCVAGKDTIKFALNGESIMSLLTKWKKSVAQQHQEEKNNATEGPLAKLLDTTEKLIVHLQQQLITLLRTAQVENLNALKIDFNGMKKKIVQLKEDYESYSDVLMQFDWLSLLLKKYNAHVAVLRNRIDEYRSNLINYFAQEHALNCSVESSLYSSRCQFFSKFFLKFPYEKELLAYIVKIGAAENATISDLLHEVVDVILNCICNNLLSDKNASLSSGGRFKLHLYYNFGGLFHALGNLHLESKRPSELEVNRTSLLFHCYRDLVRLHDTDSQKADELYGCLEEIVWKQISPEEHIYLLTDWRTVFQYFVKSIPSVSSIAKNNNSIDDDDDDEDDYIVMVRDVFGDYQRNVCYNAGLEILNLLQPKTTSSSCVKMSFLPEVVLYLEEGRIFEANLTFFLGVLRSFAPGRKAPYFEVKNLDIVDNPCVESWNSLAVEVLSVLLEEITCCRCCSLGEEKILELGCLFEAMVCALNRWKPLYDCWSLFFPELRRMEPKSAFAAGPFADSINWRKLQELQAYCYNATHNEFTMKSMRTLDPLSSPPRYWDRLTVLQHNTNILKKLQDYHHDTLEKQFTKTLKLEDLGRIAAIVHIDYNDPKTDHVEKALKFFYHGLKLFELQTKKMKKDSTEKSIAMEDQIYLCFRLSALYLKLEELSSQQLSNSVADGKFQEEMEAVFLTIQEFTAENPVVQSSILEKENS
jgi:hypothetical protein